MSILEIEKLILLLAEFGLGAFIGGGIEQIKLVVDT